MNKIFNKFISTYALAAFYVVFYSLFLAFVFNLYISPALVGKGEVLNMSRHRLDNHEYLVSQIKKIKKYFSSDSTSDFSSELPKFSLDFSTENSYDFNTNLPFSGFQYRKCEYTFQQERKKCEFNLHTKSWWHWGNRLKSYGLRTPREFDFLGTNKFSLLKPKFLFFPSAIIYSQYAKKYGVYSPNYELVLFYLNGEYQGPYIAAEKVDTDFLDKKIMSPGTLISHDSKDLIRSFSPSHATLTHDQYDLQMERNSMYDADTWSVSAFTGSAPDVLLLKSIFEKIKNDENVDQIFDLEYSAKQLALDAIFAIHHRSNSINNDWFVNSIDKKLYYIPVDSGPFLYTDNEADLWKNDFLKLMLKNEKISALYKKYLYKFVIEDKIFDSIKSDIVRYERILREPVARSPDFNTIHPFSFGAMGSSEFYLNTFFHYFDANDFSNEAYLNLAAIIRREEFIKAELSRDVKIIPPEPSQKRATKDRSCIIDHSNNFLDDLSKRCPKNSIVIGDEAVMVKDLTLLKLSNFKIRNLQKNIYFSNIDTVIINNFDLLPSSPSLYFSSIRSLEISSLRSAQVFGDGISLSNIKDVRLKDIYLTDILKVGINCSNIKHFMRENVEIRYSFQDFKVNNCQ